MDDKTKLGDESHPIRDAVAKVVGITVEASAILSGEGGEGPELAREVAELETGEFLENVLDDEDESK